MAVIKLVNKNIKPCLSELKKKIVDTDARKKLKEICLNELDKVYEQKKIIESLKEEDEPKQITKFNVKVAQELTKINNLEAHLKTVAEKLLPTPKDDENIETPEGGDRRSSIKLTSKSGNDTDKTGAEDEQPTASSSSDQGLPGKLMSNTLKSNADSEASKTDADKAKDVDDGNKYVDDNDDDDDEDEDEEEDEEDEVKGSNLENRPPLVASRSETSSGKMGGSKITEKADRDAMLNQVKQSGVTDDHDERQDDVSKDDDDDDADEEETGMDQKELTTENIDEYVALETFEGQEEGDLPFQKGDVLKIKAKRSDGWMLAVDEKGREGLVPANFLKPSADTGQRKIDDADDDRGNEEEIDEDEDDDDDDDKVGEIKSDEEVNDDEADNDVENKGDGQKYKQINKSGKSLASQLKHSLAHMSKSEQRELIDRLSNVPSGYRLSTLAKFKSEARYSLKYVLHPKLSKSGLIYKDLLMLPVTNEMLPTRCRFQSIIKLLSIRNIPLPSSQSGMQCLEGFVRICLFDGQKLLSNITTIKVQKLDVNASEWKFANQSSGSCLECAELFLRTNSTSQSIGLLCELTLLLATDFGMLEMSCGWSFIKLLNDDGTLIANKAYRLPVNGGSPFEKGVPLDRGSNLSLAASKFSLSSKSKGPAMISIKMISPTKTQTRYIECLPEPIVGPACHLEYFFYLRHIMLDVQVRFRTNLHSTDPVHSPLLSSFLDAAERAELMDVFTSAWSAKMKSMSRSEKKSLIQLKRTFAFVFMESVYPLLHICHLDSLPPYDVTHYKARQEQVLFALTATTVLPSSLPTTTTTARGTSNSKQRLAGIDLLTSPFVLYEPFDTQELIFNPVDERLILNYF